MAQGGLWNSFLFAARGAALREVYERRLPGLLGKMAAALDATSALALERFYAELVPADFSRDVLQGEEERLRVLRVPECGWTDLGTPERVAQCVERLAARGSRAPGRRHAHDEAAFSLHAALRAQAAASVGVA
jgi:hypothetical protein